jgi:MtN3 and saliva related transmembrane protein
MHHAVLAPTGRENHPRGKTAGISLITQSAFTLGIALWAAYGLILNNQPIIYAKLVTLVFSSAILILKIRYP